MHLATRTVSRRFGDAAATLHRGEALDDESALWDVSQFNGGICACCQGPKCRHDHRLKQHPKWMAPTVSLLEAADASG